MALQYNLMLEKAQINLVFYSLLRTFALSNKILMYTRMKIINSHYIPLPEPRWLIVDSYGFIYEQLGALTVVEEVAKKGGRCVMETHSFPVVANSIADVYDESNEDGMAMSCSLAPADGRVLGDTELEDCFRLCPVNHRIVPYLKFNLLARSGFHTQRTSFVRLEKLWAALHLLAYL